MGNPHAVMRWTCREAPVCCNWVRRCKPARAFPQGVNVGFMQVQDRSHIRLRVYERGTGETLACGSGACAAVVAGIRLGLLDTTRGRGHARRAPDHHCLGRPRLRC
jgi:diaminopimelate epimerase